MQSCGFDLHKIKLRVALLKVLMCSSSPWLLQGTSLIPHAYYETGS